MKRSFPVLGLATLAAFGLLGGCLKTNKDPPKNMPAYAHLYPGSQNVMSVEIGPETADMMTTADNPDTVIAWYRTEATADGLQETQTPTTPSSGGEQKAAFTDPSSGKMLVVIAKPNDASHGGQTMVDITFPTAKAPS